MKILLARLFRTPQDIINQAIVFLVIFITAEFADYVFLEWSTTPSIFWPQTGIILAIIYIGGYRYAPVIFVALMLSMVSGQNGYIFPWSLIVLIGRVISGVVGAYLLHRYDYNSNQSKVTDVVHFLIIVVLVSMITPSITTISGILLNTVTDLPEVVWSRAWAGQVLSCLILFPLIISWLSRSVSKQFSIYKTLEGTLIFCLLFISVKTIFWSQAETQLSILFFAILFISLFWSCLRFSTKIVNVFITFGTLFGIVGLIIFSQADVLLTARLFTAELIFIIAIPVFYIFSAVVQDSAKTLSDLAQTKNVIEKENATKNEFIAVLAHELRNPLAPLKTTLEILELETLSLDSKSQVQNAHRQVQTMQRLLDDLLDITRIKHGKFELKKTPVNLCTTLAHCIESTKEICKKRRHHIIMDKVCDDSIWLDVDPIRFEQVIVNIINNAAKYTNIGGEIRIRHFVRGTEAILEIQDNGIGISPENLDSIFDSFWQVKKIVPHSNGGIGVGLSLTKQIVEMHGGTITAKSDGIDKGSTFIVTLPLSKSIAVAYSPVEKQTIPLRGLRILVADDNIAAATALAKLLRLKNHTVKSVYTGSEVLNIVTQFKPDCVILDIGLPDLDGYQVAKKLRETGYKNKIIALTGYGQKEDIEKALSNGFDIFITKPVGLKQLEDYFRQIAP